MNILKGKDEKIINNISVSFDEKYHILNESPLYSKKFDHVMSFHKPGLAAVKDSSGSYHIDIKGNAAYKRVFLSTFGFYNEIAAVSDESGFFHIRPDGSDLHNSRYAWSGNFQEDRCVVRDFSGDYFHIDNKGNKPYSEKYAYVGDYKYGIACVYDYNGLATHIDLNGHLIHGKMFEECSPFHKGHSVVKEKFGYFHIDKYGNELYSERFLWIESYYNGVALCRTKDGRLCRLSDKGELTAIYEGK
ncbi:hypothetical protein [Methanoplanus limicola]|uniref:Uncharacterized protein n=1 Tax=Methanoplanus limicola DSM 2279 TaxID=937775 RepID=H1Z055_9EURY|nr:hypothetical protein [Methanoplanus limicola]EHQ36147.1 hypothetical protein Metlim_2062 [Methanoplanus limicola DSM 2279]